MFVLSSLFLYVIFFYFHYFLDYFIILIILCKNIYSFDEFVDNLIIMLLRICLKTFLEWFDPTFM